MPGKPKVSVCIASYNHARYIGETLDSVLAQTFRDYEVIVVDDGSSDDSLRVIEGYAARHPNVKCFTHPGRVNKGISVTTNFAVENARGEYIAFIGSDDAWYPEKLEKQVALLDSEPKTGMTYSRAHFIDEHGNRRPGEPFGWDIAVEGDPLERLILNNPIPALTVVVRRECFEQVGLFDADTVYSDWEMWMRIMAHWQVRFVDDVVALYRVHGRNVSVGIPSQIDIKHKLRALVALRDRSATVGGKLSNHRIKSLIAFQTAYLSFLMDDRAGAAEALTSAFRADASLPKDVTRFCEWLDATRLAGTYEFGDGTDETGFAAWAIEHSSSVAAEDFIKRATRKMASRKYARAAFESRPSDLRSARRMVLKCLMNDPLWLSDRRIQSVLAETLVGTRVMARARRAKKMLVS